MRTRVGLVFDEIDAMPTMSNDHQLASDCYSIETVALIEKEIENLGLACLRISGIRTLAALVAAEARSLVSGFINLASGLPSDFRLGQTPMLLEMLGLPYSGCDPFTMMFCRDKQRTKMVAREYGAQIPPGLFVTRDNLHLLDGVKKDLYPLIVKPNFEGSSIGIENSVAHDREGLRALSERLVLQYPQGLIVERFIPGLEVTAIMIGNGESLSCDLLVLTDKDGRSTPPDFVYGYKEKFISNTYEWKLLSDYFTEPVIVQLEDLCKILFRNLKLRDLGRMDFRIDSDGTPYFLECNGLPVILPESGMFRAVNMLKYKEPRCAERKFITEALRRMSLL